MSIHAREGTVAWSQRGETAGEVHKYEADVVGFQAPVVWKQGTRLRRHGRDGNTFLDWDVRRAGGKRRALPSAARGRRAEGLGRAAHNYECANEQRIEAAERLVQAFPNTSTSASS